MHHPLLALITALCTTYFEVYVDHLTNLPTYRLAESRGFIFGIIFQGVRRSPDEFTYLSAGRIKRFKLLASFFEVYVDHLMNLPTYRLAESKGFIFGIVFRGVRRSPDEFTYYRLAESRGFIFGIGFRGVRRSPDEVTYYRLAESRGFIFGIVFGGVLRSPDEFIYLSAGRIKRVKLLASLAVLLASGTRFHCLR